MVDVVVVDILVMVYDWFVVGKLFMIICLVDECVLVDM